MVWVEFDVTLEISAEVRGRACQSYGVTREKESISPTAPSPAGE